MNVRTRVLVPAILPGLVGLLVLSGPAPGAPAKPHRPPRPVVTKITPAAGPTTGTTKVTIKGKHLAGTSKVLFGKTKATGLKVKSDRKVVALAPAHAAGTVDVRVRTKGGKSAKVKADTFTYASPPLPPGQAPLPPDASADPKVLVIDVACQATGSCVAVGQYQRASGGQRLLVHVLKNGTWKPASPPLPGDAAADPGAALASVSCPTPSFCAAAGGYLSTDGDVHPLIETWNGTTWTPTSLALPPGHGTQGSIPLRAISCATPTSCAAVGSYSAPLTAGAPLIATLAAGSWSTQAGTVPGGSSSLASLNDVSCPGGGSCVAVGRYFNGSSVSRPLVETLASGTWSNLGPALPGDAGTAGAASLAFVDCVAVGTCTAVGSYTTAAFAQLGLQERLVTGTWAPSALAPPGGASNPLTEMSAIDCVPGTTTCKAGGVFTANAGGRRVVMVTFTAGTPDTLDMPLYDAADDPQAAVTDLACGSASSCAGGGVYARSAGTLKAMQIKTNGSNATGTPAPVPTGSANSAIVGVAIMGSGSAAAVGYFIDAAGHQQGLLLTGVPA